jgi:hypothetical protein
LVCGPPPAGRAKWSTALLAEEASRRRIVPSVGRETIRLVLATHGLKPWREKNVVRSRNQQGIHQSDGGASRTLRKAL